eukprot:99965_1
MAEQFDSITVTSHKDVLLIKMHGASETGTKNLNVWNPQFTQQFNSALHYAESIKGQKCLVITGTESFFSAGIDFKHFVNGLSNEMVQNSQLIRKQISSIFKKLLSFNMPTVAAINGHAFGIGLLIALCCDYRIMKKECGKLCMPAVKLSLTPNKAWRKIMPSKLPSDTIRTAMLTGKQYGSKQAFNAQIIDEEINAENNDSFIEKCIEFASMLTRFAHNRENYSQIKNDLYCDIIKDLNDAIGTSKL